MKIESSISQLLTSDYPLIHSCDTCIESPTAITNIAEAGVFPFLNVSIKETPEILAKKIKEIKNLTSKSFGVSLVKENLTNHFIAINLIKVVVENEIKLVEVGLPVLLRFSQLLKNENIQIFCKCFSLKEALTAQEHGCAAVMMMGGETCEGTKRNSMSSLQLIPKAVEKLVVPVIACGGFDGGKGLVAAFSFGAQAVGMERCLSACDEVQNIINDIVIQACKVVNYQLAPLK